MLTRRYQDFSKGLATKVEGTRTPLRGTIELTHRCPLTCSHCYNNLPMADGDARRAELSLAEHHRIVDEIVDAGCFWLLYTGGEIFARKDFVDIYRHARRKGVLITLFTNGILINESVADALAELPPFSIEITLYGATRETYEGLTRIPRSYERCLRGIELLLERKLPLKLKTVGLSINKHELHAMRKMADDWGVAFKFDAMMSPRIDCSSSPLAVRLTPEEVVALDLHDEERMAGWIKKIARQSETLETNEAKQALYACGGGLSSFAIDPYGSLSICVLSQEDKFDLRRGSFREGWEHFLGQVRGRKRKVPSKCIECSLKNACGMCPAQGELENGDAEKPVEFLCEVAHLRAHALGFDVAPHGDCEFCKGGERYAQIVEGHQRLQVTPKSEWYAPPPSAKGRLLPIVRDAQPGCGSCG